MAQLKYEQQRDDEQESMAKKHKKKHKREESLVDLHQKKLRKEQREKVGRKLILSVFLLTLHIILYLRKRNWLPRVPSQKEDPSAGMWT